MITKRTVFILGAGANVPYGFSTGGGLVEKARRQDPRVLMGNAGEQLSARQGAAFQQAAADNLLPSIDALLEYRADLVPVGKRLMAALLYKEEAQAAPRTYDEDWMRLIFSYMAEDAPNLEAFAGNPVSFVTFNYDRYMEHRFIRGLVSRYPGVEAYAAWQALAPMFIHLYGTLGQLPEQIPPEQTDWLRVALGAPDTPDVYTLGLALPIAENAIRIVHDAEAPPQSFAGALERFQTAEQVFFLGFGFGKKNVKRLQTERIDKDTKVFCTTYDMTPAELEDLVFPAFPKHQQVRSAGPSGDKPIRMYLRERMFLFR